MKSTQGSTHNKSPKHATRLEVSGRDFWLSAIPYDNGMAKIFWKLHIKKVKNDSRILKNLRNEAAEIKLQEYDDELIPSFRIP